MKTIIYQFTHFIEMIEDIRAYVTTTKDTVSSEFPSFNGHGFSWVNSDKTQFWKYTIIMQRDADKKIIHCNIKNDLDSVVDDKLRNFLYSTVREFNIELFNKYLNHGDKIITLLPFI